MYSTLPRAPELESHRCRLVSYSGHPFFREKFYPSPVGTVSQQGEVKLEDIKRIMREQFNTISKSSLNNKKFVGIIVGLQTILRKLTFIYW